MEILFEQDNEEKSVASVILDCLVKVKLYYSVVDTEWRQHGGSLICSYFPGLNVQRTRK